MEQQIPADHDYIYSLYEVCEILGKSSRTISRYVRRNILHPAGIKSRQGTLEYRFSKAEIEAVRRDDALLKRLVFPQSYAMPEPGMATFANVNYQQLQTMRPAPFFMPVGPRQPAPDKSKGYTDSPVPVLREEKPADKPVETKTAVPDKKEETPTKRSAFDVGVSQDSVLDQNRSNEQIIILLKETTGMLRDQLKVKDDQIKNLDDKIGQLIERNRETNILLKGLQDKMVLLEKPKNERKAQTRQEKPLSPGPGVVLESATKSVAENPDINPVKIKVTNAGEPVAARAGLDRVEPSTPPAVPGLDEWQSAPDKDSKQSKGLFGKFFRQDSRG